MGPGIGEAACVIAGEGQGVIDDCTSLSGVFLKTLVVINCAVQSQEVFSSSADLTF